MPPTPQRQPSPVSGGTFPLPGSVIDNKYVVEEEIGSGGMGVVVAARHVALQQRFAIKFLVSGIDDPDTVERFVREARATSELKSEHVVRVWDVGELPSGQPYFVMEYLEGEDVGSLLASRGRLRITEAVGFVLQACEAVAEAHSRGIVHRDLKPGNLFLTSRPDGTAQIKVVDFGVSKVHARDATDFQETDGKSLLGSPYYMSPEQVRSASQVDERSDIWSMGVTLYELLTGARAFDAPTMPALAVKIASDPYESAIRLRPELPTGIDSIIRKCLAKDPALRYQSVAQLASALSPFAGSDARIAARRAVRITRQTTLSGSLPAVADATLSSSGARTALETSHPALSVEAAGEDDIGTDQARGRKSPPAKDSPSLAEPSQRNLWAALAVAAVLILGVGVGVRALTTSATSSAIAVGATPASSSESATMIASSPNPLASAAASDAGPVESAAPNRSQAPSLADGAHAHPLASESHAGPAVGVETMAATAGAPAGSEHAPPTSATESRPTLDPLVGRH